MGDYDSAKYWAKQGVRRGLQKTRYYCQICQRQCKDANGFQSHNKSPSHLRKISQVTAEDAKRYNDQFEKGFLQLLMQRHCLLYTSLSIHSHSVLVCFDTMPLILYCLRHTQTTPRSLENTIIAVPWVSISANAFFSFFPFNASPYMKSKRKGQKSKHLFQSVQCGPTLCT